MPVAEHRRPAAPARRYFDYINFNATGYRPYVTTLYAVLLGCLRKALSRMLVLIVAMGFGVVLPYLGAVQKKARGCCASSYMHTVARFSQCILRCSWKCLHHWQTLQQRVCPLNLWRVSAARESYASAIDAEAELAAAARRSSRWARPTSWPSPRWTRSQMSARSTT